MVSVEFNNENLVKNMRKQILEINEKLRIGAIEENEAKQLLLILLGGSFSFEDMANFAVWIKDNFSDEIAGAFARRSDGNLYWDEQVGDLVKLWCENCR